MPEHLTVKFARIAAIVFASLSLLAANTAWAAEGAAPEQVWFIGVYGFWWLVGLGCSVLALLQAWQFFKWMEAQPAGSQKMIDIAGYVRTGADA